jgi:hypothetical protein
MFEPCVIIRKVTAKLDCKHVLLHNGVSRKTTLFNPIPSQKSSAYMDFVQAENFFSQRRGAHRGFWSAAANRHQPERRRFCKTKKSGAALAFRLCLSPHSKAFSPSHLVTVFSVCSVGKEVEVIGKPAARGGAVAVGSEPLGTNRREVFLASNSANHANKRLTGIRQLPDPNSFGSDRWLVRSG